MSVCSRVRRASSLLAVVLAASPVLLAGCGTGSGGVVARSAYVEFSPEQKAEISARGQSEYRIKRGDVLTIAFPYERTLTQEGVLVLDDGAVGLIGVDRVQLAGLTMTEADSVITAAYSQEYREPDLSVIMYKSSGRPVYVMGEVRQPGVYDVPSAGIDIVSAVSLAGGFLENAAKDGTVVVRVTPDGYTVQEIDLSRFTDVSSAALGAVFLQPYDIVYVPRSRQGDFAVFTRSVLSGLVNLTRIAADINYLSTGGIGRY